LADLTKHVFVTGVTGSGKTTTCMKLLIESKLPFMVIEPAKTEYRALHSLDSNIEYYILGREDLTPFRLNPFELVSRQENLAGHISTLNATLGAVFPMEAAMPYLVEEAIIKAYKAKGWDIHSSENFLVDDPWVQGSDAWPTFADMIGQLEGVIKSKGMGKEFEEKYLGSLVGRLSNLTLGVKGRMLNTRHSLDFDSLLDKRVVIELEELKDEQDKALLMGLILTRLAECMKHRHRRTPDFRHLTLVEEAHRLLARSEPGDPGSKKLGVETFANLLAEVRKYGEGLIIADQIPNKLVADVIKNTHTKIVHRLFSADDRNTIGDAMGLSDEQKDFLPLLQTGETIIYCGGWHAPVWVKIEQKTDTNSPEIAEEEMKAKGIEQLWAQRSRLFPSLSARPEMSNGEVLGRFASEGIKLINILLTVNGAVDAGKKSEDDVDKLQQRFAKRFAETSAQAQVTTACAAEWLTCLFFDATGFSASEKTEALTRKVLPVAFEALSASVAAFKEYRATPEGRSVLQMDVNFKKLESL
jgi:shikimate kinase